jgi:putative sterol carrier protein
MAVFQDVEVIRKIFVDLWTHLIEKTEFGPKMREADLSVLYVTKDPEVYMYVDGHGVLFGEEAKAKDAVLTMAMSGDTVHKFWLKKLNVPKALALRQIKAKGPVPKMLKLLPLLKPGYELYEEACRKYNIPTDV